MMRPVCAAIACAVAAALAPAADAHTGSVHISAASVTGPNQILVQYSGAMGSDQGCAECGGASYSDLVLFPGGARSVESVSADGDSHTISFGGPAAAKDAVARFHVGEAVWAGGSHSHDLADASASALDGQGPEMLWASVDLDAGSAVLKFDEKIAAFDPLLVSAGGAALPAGYSIDGDSVKIELGERLRSQLSALESVSVSAGAGASEDAAGNGSAARESDAAVIPDTTPPRVLWSESVLDLGAGTLSLAFDEYVRISGTGSMSLGDEAGTLKVGLGGARFGGEYSDAAVLELTGPQKAAALDPDFADVRLRPTAAFPQPSPEDGLSFLRIDSGVRDAAGLGLFGGAQGGAVRVSPDGVPPGVADGPSLDLSDGRVTITFDEHIDAYGVDRDGMRLRSGDWSVPLSAYIAGSDGYDLVVFMDEEARLASAGLGFDLEMDAGSVSDLSGNPLPESKLAVEVSADGEPPVLAHAYLNPSSGVLTAEFDEPISDRLAPALASVVEEGHSSHRVRLYASAPYEIDGTFARITLTQQQKLDVSSFRTHAVLEISSGAVSDLSGNANGPDSVRVSISGDSRPPEPVSASLDAGDGLLVVSFDEPMDPTPESVSVDAMSLRSGGASVPLLTAAVRATVAGVEGGDVSVVLAERQRQWVLSHGAPLYLQVGAGAARDASANPVAGQHELKIEADVADLAGPSAESAVLDLGRGLLTVAFDEDVESVDASKLVLRGPPDSGVALEGAQALAPDGQSASVQLSAAQNRAVSDWGTMTLDSGAGAAADTSGNPSPEAAGAPVRVLPDKTPPEMISASLSGPDRISVVFSEDLYDPSVSASDFEVGGLAVAAASDDDGTVTLDLAERVRSSDGRALRVELVGHVADEHGNLLQSPDGPPYADAPNDLSFAGAESFTIESDNALSPGYAKAGDTITVRMATDAPIDSAAVEVNSNEADVEQGSRSLVARYVVSDSDRDGPVGVSVTVHAAGERGGASSFSEADADGSVSIDNTAPEYDSASLAGRHSMYLHYSEPVMTELTQYRDISVGSGDPAAAVYAAGSGTSGIIVEWEGDGAGPNSPEIKFEIDDSVSDLAGNLISNPGEHSMTPPSSAAALALLRAPGDGRVFLAHDTFVARIEAPDGAFVNIGDFGPPRLADPAVDRAGGYAVQFPQKEIVLETDKSIVTFPPGLQAGGFADDRVIVARDSDLVPNPSFAGENSGIDPEAAVVLEFGSPGEDIALSVPVLIQLKDLIEKESVVFSIDDGGDTRELRDCTVSMNTDTAAEYISSEIRPLGSAVADGGACVDKENGAIWTVRFSTFGAVVPAAAAPDCDLDCTAPTFGVDSSGSRIVSDGFEYNGQAVDVGRFFTAYPAVTAEVGHTNTAVLKIYDDSGPGAIEHVGLAFGLREGQSISESLVEISWGADSGGSVTLFDPEGAIDPASVGVDSSQVPCSPGSSDTCLRLEVLHAFQAPLEFDMVGTDAWDEWGNSWQNYYNHAVHVEGDGGAPDGVLVNGGSLLLHRIGAGVEVLSDGAGLLYRLSPDGEYRPLTNSSALYRESDDSWRDHEGHEDRREGAFREAVAAEALAAQAVAERITGGPTSNPDFGMPAALQFYEQHYGARDGAALEDALASERQRAAEIARLLFGDFN